MIQLVFPHELTDSFAGKSWTSCGHDGGLDGELAESIVSSTTRRGRAHGISFEWESFQAGGHELRHSH